MGAGKPVFPGLLFAFLSETLAFDFPTDRILWRNLEHAILGRDRGHTGKHGTASCLWPWGSRGLQAVSEAPALLNYALRRARFQGPGSHHQLQICTPLSRPQTTFNTYGWSWLVLTCGVLSVSMQSISGHLHYPPPGCSRKKGTLEIKINLMTPPRQMLSNLLFGGDDS